MALPDKSYDAGYRAGVALWETYLGKLPRIAHVMAVRVVINGFRDALETYLLDEKEEDEQKKEKE